MAKSADKGNDSTMELSASQLVPEPGKSLPRPSQPAKRPSAVGQPAMLPNDASVWKRVVVGSDEFAPGPKPGARSSKRLASGIVVVAALGGGAYLLWGRGDAKHPPAKPPELAAPAPTAASTPPPETPAGATPAIAAAIDAGVDAAGATISATSADTVSGVAAPIIPAPKSATKKSGKKSGSKKTAKHGGH